MRLLFLNPAGGLGGAERALGDLVVGLAAERPELVMRLVALEDGPLVERVRDAGATAVVIEAPEALRSFGDTRLRGASPAQLALQALGGAARAAPALARFGVRLRGEIEAFRPDVVHSNGVKTHVLSALLGGRAPLVWHLRDFVGARPLAARILRPLAHRARVGLAISEAVRRDAAHALPGLPLRLLMDATDLEAFRPGEVDPSLLDALAEPPAPPPSASVVRVGLVSTFARWKGHEVFLQAAAELARSRPELPLRFYVVGGPIYATAGSQFSRGELESLAERLGITDRVAFVPFQRELLPVYRALDVVVHASTRPEPFGLAITEAMACGRAVVASAAGGAAEIVSPGRDGLTHPMGDAGALAEAIARLAENPELRAAFGREARKTVVARFSRSRLVADALGLFSELARSGRRS